MQQPPGQEPLRDWQKNTWYGAAPVNGNPFDEPEDAPELREARSENLNNRSGTFWDQQTGGYQYSGAIPRQGTGVKAANPEGEKSARTGKRKVLSSVLTALVVTALVFVLLYYGLFTVREIRVVGNARVDASEVVRLSGIRQGTPIFSIREEDVARGLKGNAYLQYRYLDRELPGTVVLTVKEREACCWMTWCGIFYTMDKQRVVLFETEEQNVRPAGLVKVDGLRIRSGCMVGQTLTLESAEQQELFSQLFLEMKVLGCTESIEEADLSNLYSILLTTRDGFTVSMGDAADIHAKLRAMLLTRDELIRRGYHGGVINVINPETPIFSPEEQTGV